MNFRRWVLLLTSLVLLACAVAIGFRPRSWRVVVTPSLEDRLPDGGYFNPNTQSLLRGVHWLERVREASITVQPDGSAAIDLSDPDGRHSLTIQSLRLDWIVPRFHYEPAEPPDRFDAYNLMLAEYSRNSLSVPVGKPSDAMAHFETDMEETVPWNLSGDYQFVPNPDARPVRVAVVNNCLAPGLWELTASDRTGETYHAWFDMPKPLYTKLVAVTNGIDLEFAAQAVDWNDRPVPLQLDRLRTTREQIAQVSIEVIEDLPSGYSSQDSRRKLRKHFVEVQQGDTWNVPRNLGDLTQGACRFSNFIAPGKYARADQKEFDFQFLRAARSVDVSRVTPLTDYDWRRRGRVDRADAVRASCIELSITLDDYVVVLGNLPTSLLVPQEDFTISGFGVGILSSGGIAERRRYLIEDGPPPSFAYLCKKEQGELIGLNSHDFGIEQIFIRTHNSDERPWWEVTITSYERIVDIVKYRIEVPDALQQELRDAALRYVSPLYRTYRDDNVR